MSTLTPGTAVHWTDPSGAQQGPTPANEIVGRIERGELSPETPLWWPEAPGWTPANQAPGLAEHLQSVAPPTQAAPDGGHAIDALMAGLSDQELDDEFLALIDRSWDMYKETEKAATIDETIVGGIITALVDSGFVLIDIGTGLPPGLATAPPAGAPAAPAAGSPVGAAPSGAEAGPQHSLRFEVPTTGARVTVELQHLTPGLAASKVLNHRANLVVGYGERLGNAGQIGQALRSEVASAFVATPEPGTVSFDADISSGYVYARIELFLEPDRYVDDKLAVDHDLLRRHIAALVHTMRTFVHTRFGS